jgi:nonsense-mediated mRNA decay protein 3
MKEQGREKWNKFCPQCGKQTDELFDSLCKACFTKAVRLLDVAQVEIGVSMCGTCGGYFKGKERTSVEAVVIDSVRRDIRKQYGYDCNVDVSRDLPAPLTGEKGIKAAEDKVRLFLTVKAEVEGVAIEEKGEVVVILKKETCDRCSKISGGYYAGIVQIRAEDRIPADDELAMAEEIAYLSLGEADFVSKEKMLKEGLDIYVSSMDCGRRISRRIVKKLGGSFSESRRLYGQKDGRNVYRVSFSVRLPGFEAGALVDTGDTVLSVERVIRGKGIECVDKSTGERVFLNKKEMKKAKRVDARSSSEV